MNIKTGYPIAIEGEERRDFEARRIVITLADGSWFEFYDSKDNQLILHADAQLIIKPGAANTIEIRSIHF